MKKILLAAFLGTAVLLTSCNSDDNTIVTPIKSDLEGTWEAKTFKYTMPDGQEHEFEFSRIKQGCAVDILTLTADKKAVLKEENKVNEACEPSTTNGTYTAAQITFGENVREVISVNASDLVLKYEMMYGGFGTADVVVTYGKK